MSSRIIGYLFVAIVCGAGPFMLLIVAGTGIERALFIHSSLSSDGVIVGLSPTRPNRPSDRSRRPVFRFTTKEGRTITVVSNIAQRPSPWTFGDHVRVLYQPSHPENARIDSFAQLWEPQIVLGVVGGAFSMIPLLILLRRRQMQR
jgi:Protein of unknown function (DUF3592)